MRGGGQRGQTLVLAALLILMVVTTVFVTFAIGHRTREKIKLQATADATAYSLAVAQTRAFNFYALSNRAIVAHMVSTLSVMSHQSYLDWYEDMLVSTVEAFRRASSAIGACGAASNRAHRVADLYWLIMPRLAGKPVDARSYFYDEVLHPAAVAGLVAPADAYRVFVEQAGTPRLFPSTPITSNQMWKDLAHHNAEYASAGDKLHARGMGYTSASWSDVKGARGAQFVHDQYHGKADGQWCVLIGAGYADHYEKVQLIRAHQHNVERQLKGLMGDTDYNSIDVAKLENALNDRNATDEVEDGTENSSVTSIRYTVNLLPGGSAANEHTPHVEHVKSMGELVAEQVDPKIRFRDSAKDANLLAYKRAVSNPGDGEAQPYKHRDYDEIVAGTRYPNWLTERAGGDLANIDDWNFGELLSLARQLAGPDTITVRARNWGTTKILSENDLPSGALSDANMGLPLADTSLGPTWYTHVSNIGGYLATAIHQDDHSTGWGENNSIGAEDHGDVRVTYSGGGCASTQTIEQAPGRNAIWNRSDDAPFARHHHLWHGEENMFGAHRTDGPWGDNMYRGHVRFKLSDNEDNLWNMPRTFALMTRPINGAGVPRKPWDFDFQARLPAPVSFKTLDSNGDLRNGNQMAAIAAGLTYFHKDEASTDAYKEPPNLWNPFWRAKLHPVRRAEALVGAADHNESRAVIDALGQRSLNY